MNRQGVPRPLLPQSKSMQNFSFTSPNPGLGDSKKNYVFVDEHNRHKRLKVMRACEGCRRRKIKCDAATTNSWPCAACVRLKLQCIPPSVNYHRSQSLGGTSGLERVLDFDSSGGSGDEGDYLPPSLAPNFYQLGMGSDVELLSPHSPYTSDLSSFHGSPYAPKAELQYHLSPHANITSMPMSAPPTVNMHNHSFPMPVHVVDGNDTWLNDESPFDLNEVLGELKIDETGIAPYIYQQKKTLAEAPALEEFEMALPAALAAASTPTGSTSATVRIPPALMPSEELAAEYFDVFFNAIHPYVPVVSKAYFYQQWHTSRRSISPLLLEAIFACAGRLSSDAAQGAQWLALASKHENCFMDVPRLSTIQALLILLKAREAAPKRGYYYRSWMTVQTIVTMAKDLELDHHYADHQAGRSCGSDATECLVKTRIWQTIFVCEMMVGGPQGRFDMSVPIDTVDITIPQPTPGVDDAEYQTSRNFAYFVRSIRHNRLLHEVYVNSRQDRDWGSKPSVTALNPMMSQWLEELPGDLQIHYPPDGSAPWLPSHFVANMHIHHQLSLIMLHRPQLMNASSFTPGGAWQTHMAVCREAAQSLCRLQEALVSTHGMDGLLCMQRGINFAIYSILVCTVLHLVAITSPDAALHADAPDFFARHMRLLERCVAHWPMPDLTAQIESLRDAFSADTSKPFELKRSFPFGSPGASPSPVRARHFGSESDLTFGGQQQQQQQQRQQQQHDSHKYRQQQQQHFQHQQRSQPTLQFNSRPMTPPLSGEADEAKSFQTSMAMGMMSAESANVSVSGEVGGAGEEALAWNPTRIFDQWNTAFGTPPPSGSVSAAATTLGQVSPAPFHTPPSSIFAATTHPTSDAAVMAALHDAYTVSSSSAATATAAAAAATTTCSSSSPTDALSASAGLGMGMSMSMGSAGMNGGGMVAFTSGGGSVSGVHAFALDQMPPAVGGGQAFVSPSMWRDTVASSYGVGLKRKFV